MPQVQFARADLPWLFTPAAPGTAETRLRPWLVLVAVRRGDGVRLASPAGRCPCSSSTRRAAELPDLAQSWAWAHAQISGLPAGAQPADVLAADPGPRLLAAASARAAWSRTPPTSPASCPRSPPASRPGSASR